MHIPNDTREITNETDEFKPLIEAARADMASHPAFSQESIKSVLYGRQNIINSKRKPTISTCGCC